MERPEFLEALLYLFIAALMGGLIVWLWMRLRIQDLNDLLNRKNTELAILKQAEIQWKASKKNYEVEKESLLSFKEKAEKQEQEIQDLRSRLTEQAVQADDQVSVSELEAKLEKAEKARPG